MNKMVSGKMKDYNFARERSILKADSVVFPVVTSPKCSIRQLQNFCWSNQHITGIFCERVVQFCELLIMYWMVHFILLGGGEGGENDFCVNVIFLVNLQQILFGIQTHVSI